MDTRLETYIGDPAFDRIREACDLPRLTRARVVLAGAGGASAAIVNLARMGVAEFVLIDPDRVEATNIATQDYERADIGRFKVEALGRRLLRVNPRLEVFALAQPLELRTESRFDLFQTPMAALQRNRSRCDAAPLVSLLLGMTDHFPAQAMVNRLALRHAVPSLCVQIYREGAAFELTFTHPGTTQACHRCMLRKRYDSYAAGFRNDVDSRGSPLSTTSAANALSELVAMALLHGPDGTSRWSRLLRHIGPRNLVQVRLDPEVGTLLGLRAFERVLGQADQSRLCAGDTLWMPQARNPHCGDCADQAQVRPESCVQQS